MKYKILMIVKESNFPYREQKEMEQTSNSKIYFGAEINSIIKLLHTKDIRLIVIDPNILDSSLLENLLAGILLTHASLPMFILGKEREFKNRFASLLILDFIDISINKETLFNKIKFCSQLYKKELEHENEMQKLLYIDNLTQLPNRAKLINDIKDYTLGISSLAIIDINSFQEINDFFGYKIGDSVLKEVVSTIDEVLHIAQNKITMYKFSADVYCLANIDIEENEFENMIIYILGALESKIFIIDGHEIDIRATAGITFSTHDNKLITANIALQEAKKNKKDFIVFYDELDNYHEYKNNMLWTKKLKKALDKDNIIVYFQPLVNNETMKVDKYECLVRMIDEEKVIAPFFFLEVSKKANQYRNITKIVIEKSFKEFEHLPFDFSINVSYDDIEDKNFLNFIKYKLQKYNVANRVVWEILEDESVKSYDVLFEFIKEVKALGCKVAIDDFGSGYSNFEHLLKMDVDYLKIDASLVKYVATDENSYKVVKTIVDFANSLNLKTIAEYVENEEILNITKELGVDYSQGYYFSAPIDKPSLESFR